MSSTASFGRRQAEPNIAQRGVAPISPPAEPLGAAAEALRAELAQARANGGGSFAAWRRSRRGEQALLWALTLLFAAPGLICFVTQAPLGVSIALEVAAFVGNRWLRRAQRRRLSEIVAWEDTAPEA